MSDPTQRYISDELTHFIGRGCDREGQYALLKKILCSGWLTHVPHNPMIRGNLQININAKISENEMYQPQIVCFCDIPIQDLAIHMRKYSSFGIGFVKDFIVKAGGSPVYYIPRDGAVLSAWSHPPELADKWHEADGPEEDQAALHARTKGRYADWMTREYEKRRGLLRESDIGKELDRFFAFDIFSFMKFFDHRLPDDHEDNHYFEREWRITGNLRFQLDDVRRVIIPEDFEKRFRLDAPDYDGQLTLVD